MTWVMLTVVGLAVLVAAAAGLAALRLTVSRQALRQARVMDDVRRAQSGSVRLLAVPIVFWMILFLFVLVVLLFVSAMCLMYTFALIHGEWFLLLDSFPRTAGNVIVHLIYPLQMLLFAVITFLLAVGSFQLVLGPIEALDRFRLRVDDVAPFGARLASLLALVAGFEVLKILCYSLLVEPSQLASFFARDTLPKADPLGVALLVAALLAAVVAWWKKGNDQP